jgi:hypothetical protein
MQPCKITLSQLVGMLWTVWEHQGWALAGYQSLLLRSRTRLVCTNTSQKVMGAELRVRQAGDWGPRPRLCGNVGSISTLLPVLGPHGPHPEDPPCDRSDRSLFSPQRGNWDWTPTQNLCPTVLSDSISQSIALPAQESGSGCYCSSTPEGQALEHRHAGPEPDNGHTC